MSWAIALAYPITLTIFVWSITDQNISGIDGFLPGDGTPLRQRGFVLIYLAALLVLIFFPEFVDRYIKTGSSIRSYYRCLWRCRYRCLWRCRYRWPCPFRCRWRWSLACWWSAPAPAPKSTITPSKVVGPSKNARRPTHWIRSWVCRLSSLP